MADHMCCHDKAIAFYREIQWHRMGLHIFYHFLLLILQEQMMAEFYNFFAHKCAFNARCNMIGLTLAIEKENH